jgi:hypothetical protein
MDTASPSFIGSGLDPAIRRIEEATRRGFPSEGYRVRVHANHYATLVDDRYAKWDALLAEGKNSLVSKQTSMDDFIKSHRSPLTLWQQLAYAWASTNPDRMLTVSNTWFEWHVSQRGESVLFTLPHHDFGGEKSYATRDGKTKIQINRD